MSPNATTLNATGRVLFCKDTRKLQTIFAINFSILPIASVKVTRCKRTKVSQSESIHQDVQIKSHRVFVLPECLTSFSCRFLEVSVQVSTAGYCLLMSCCYCYRFHSGYLRLNYYYYLMFHCWMWRMNCCSWNFHCCLLTRHLRYSLSNAFLMSWIFTLKLYLFSQIFRTLFTRLLTFTVLVLEGHLLKNLNYNKFHFLNQVTFSSDSTFGMHVKLMNPLRV